MTALEWQAIILSLKLASVTTLVLMLLGLPLAWWLSQTDSRWRAVVATLVAMPLVLPPTVIGFYLLLLLGRNGPLGQLMAEMGLDTLAFSFPGLVLASVIYSAPFVIQPLHNAFAALGKRPLEVAATLRAGPFDRFFSVVLPQARHGVITAVVLGFAHTIGEFGVVLMIGGNIPGETQLVSLLLYEHVEALDYRSAHYLAAILLGFSFAVLLLLNILQGKDSMNLLGRRSR